MFLQVHDVPLLILAMLGVAWRSHKELQGDRVVVLVEVALAVQQVYPVEAVVAPAFADLELRCELADHLSAGRAVVDHLDSVLVLLGVGVGQALEHLQEDADVVAFGDAVSVWIDLESPRQPALCYERWVGVHDFIVVSNLVLALSDP